MLSGTINLIIPMLPIFEPYKYLWTVNGFTLAILWPSLIRLLSEALPRKYMAKASVIMGTTVAVGTFFVYGTSALFAKFTTFKAAFYTAAIVLIGVAIVWIAFISRLVDAQQREDEDEKKAVGKTAGADAGKSGKRVIYFSICVLAFCGILTNLIKDGLGTWVPSILKDNYELDDSLSIILALDHSRSRASRRCDLRQRACGECAQEDGRFRISVRADVRDLGRVYRCSHSKLLA